jgi:U3 small nucleolar RNA-associated protein 12
MIQAVATLPLSSRHRVSQILFHDSQPYVAVQSHDRSIEVFRIRTEDEARKKQARRRKRAKEKEEKSKPKEKDLVDKVDDDKTGAGEVGLVDLFTPYLVIRASGKVRSFDFSIKDAAGHKAKVQVSCLLRRERHSLTYCPDPFSTCVECVRSL